ncbi:putative serine/threonine-protein kinase [Apostasia shenzhenica]|uniref:Putative serine/threonine-protein kinase n=1 Tax=Apostasia shenzhenica TaxID=1088818 RepID=A0A2I0AUB8_9ASPA|nr:putative serine/threonine-protein kinase [Apostasia shenzhenica]
MSAAGQNINHAIISRTKISSPLPLLHDLSFYASQSSSQMKLTLIFLYSIDLLCFFLTLSIAANPPQNCEPKNCGGLINVSYPFWIKGLQPDYCGYPPFEVTCINNTPMLLKSLEDDYIVLNISYEQGTIRVASVRYARNHGDFDGCSVPYYNLSFSFAPLKISSANRELIFAYNCSADEPQVIQIPCAGMKSRLAYLGGRYGFPKDDGVFGSCYTAVMPVLDYPGAKVKDYPKLLANGFLLNWTAPDCTECRASGGQCGYNNDTMDFMCICPNRTYWRRCSKGHHNTALIIGISVAGALSLALFSFFCLLLCRRWKRKKLSSSSLLNRMVSSQWSSKSGPELGSSHCTPIFSYEELYEATNSFDASNELGDGGFGTVYKGQLRDGRVVAIKRLYNNNYRRLEQFMNEVKILSVLRHQHLVTLYGCTSRRSRELLLVYEFVPNGTVADHLHGSLSSKSFLPWQTRLSIAVQSADALSYLHSIEPQIIHRDVKTDNILLDNNFQVKVADFGLSRLFPVDATHISTCPQGTPGYVDPEYHRCYQLTDKSDVYSFGVVLMELISSKPAVDMTRQRNEINLATMAINKIQRRELHELVDSRLGFDSDLCICRMITQVAELAFLCLQLETEMRPCIKEVLQSLRGIATAEINREDRREGDDATVEEARLLKGFSPCSPNSVMEAWVSSSTTTSSTVEC